MNTKIKICSKDFDWIDFYGFSILFDNGNEHFKGDLLANDFLKSGDFYKILYNKFYQLSEKDPVLGDKNHFLKLPFSSWHVTVWDGINKGNFNMLKPNYQTFFERFMEGRFDNQHTEIIKIIATSLRWMNDIGEIKFSFRKLFNFQNQVLVISLKPADIDSLDKLHKLKLIRNNLNKYFLNNFGFATCQRFLPHSSLGYFVDEKSGSDFSKNNQALDLELSKSLKSKTLEFNAYSLFTFKNMASFYKINVDLK